MADVFDKDTRSAVMSKVRFKLNKSTELRLIKLFHDNDIKGWRRNYKVKGSPDFVFWESGLLYLSMVASGTVTIAEIRIQKITKCIGLKSTNVICNATI